MRALMCVYVAVAITTVTLVIIANNINVAINPD